MRYLVYSKLALIWLILCVSSNSGQAAEIYAIPINADLHVSGNGSVVAGGGVDDDGGVLKLGLYRWTINDGLSVILEEDFSDILTYYTITGINYDGSAIIGYDYEIGSIGNYFQYGFRWTETEGMGILEGSTDVIEPYGYYHAPYGMSADGTMVVGGLGGRAPQHDGLFSWQEGIGMIDHGVPAGTDGAVGAAVSADGQIISGYAVSETTYLESVFRWTEAGGYEELGAGRSTGISADGSVIIGYSDGAQAFRYSDSNGKETLGSFIPKATNADGSVIVGEDVIWDTRHGLQSIQAYLLSKGVDVESEHWVFESVTDISDNGRVIVGRGGNDHSAEVIDNLDSGFAAGTGGWGWSSAIPGAYNGNYRWASPGSGDQSTAWTFEGQPLTGYWEIFAQWSAAENRATEAVYTIYDLNGERAQVKVDQTRDGGQFNSLGVYYMQGGPTVVVLRDNPSGCVIADAVKAVFIDAGWMATLDDQLVLLDRIEIDGPAEVVENSSVRYTCRAMYTDGSQQTVTADSWTDTCDYGDVDSNGYLSTFESDEDEHCQVETAYTEDGETKHRTIDVTIRDTDIPPDLTETIIDNADPGFSSGPTAWTVSSSVPGAYQGQYLYTSPGNSGHWAKWTIDIESSGNFEVFARWTAHANRSTAAPYSILNNGARLSPPVAVDQTRDGGVFNTLGTYWFDAGSVEIILNGTPEGYVIADAVKIVSGAAPPSDDIIIDNADSGFDSGPASWAWSSFSPGGYNTHYQYAPPGDGSRWARWMFDLSSAGNFEVFAQWTAHANRSTAAPYSVLNNGTQLSPPVAVDQTRDGGMFNTLGTYWFDAGSVEVILNSAPAGYVIADAVKISAR